MATTTRRTYRVNADSWMVLRDILVGDPQEFNTDSSSLRGRIETDPYYGEIYRHEDAFKTLKGHMRAGAVNYVVYSYRTPIAYRITTANPQTGVHTHEWIVPAERYSVTTSKHQNKVRTALSQLTNGYTEV